MFLAVWVFLFVYDALLTMYLYRELAISRQIRDIDPNLLIELDKNIGNRYKSNSEIKS